MPKYAALIYGDMTQYANVSPEDGAKMMKAYDDTPRPSRAPASWTGARLCSRRNTANDRPGPQREISTTDGPFAETKEPASAASTFSTARTSTRPSSGPPRSPEPTADPSRSVPSWSSSKHRTGVRVSSTACSAKNADGRSRRSSVLTATSTLAEEAVQEAFVVALERWPRDGPPPNPGAWLTMTAATGPSTVPPPGPPPGREAGGHGPARRPRSRCHRKPPVTPSRMTGSGSSSPAATRPSLPRRGWP